MDGTVTAEGMGHTGGRVADFHPLRLLLRHPLLLERIPPDGEVAGQGGGASSTGTGVAGAALGAGTAGGDRGNQPLSSSHESLGGSSVLLGDILPPTILPPSDAHCLKGLFFLVPPSAKF